MFALRLDSLLTGNQTHSTAGRGRCTGENDPLRSVSGTALVFGDRPVQRCSDVHHANNYQQDANQDVPAEPYPAGTSQGDTLNHAKQDRDPGNGGAPTEDPVRYYESLSDWSHNFRPASSDPNRTLLMRLRSCRVRRFARLHRHRSDNRDAVQGHGRHNRGTPKPRPRRMKIVS